MNRLVALIAALALAPAALAQEAQPQGTPSQPTQDTSTAAGVDASALQGRVEAAEATLAEVKGAVDKLSRLKLSGYVQARWRWREDANYTKDAAALKADTISQTGFHVRRGRLKATYDADWSQFVLQLDAIPNGVTVKEAYAEVKLPMGIALDAGLQLFPFGYEVASRSSADLDTLERAEISRRFLAGEYDLGVALRGKVQMLSWKVGLFNGNGVEGGKATGGVDNDQLKDVIGRVTADLGIVTAGVSGWFGKVQDYTVLTAGGAPTEHDRQRVGADIQVFLDLLPLGGTALKGEYIWGKTQISDKSFGAGDKLGKTSSGWYAVVSQNLGKWNQVAVRYERFIVDHGVDRDLAANQGKVFMNSELQAAVHTFLGGNTKLSLAWFHPMYAAYGDTVTGAAKDPRKDSFIAQVQAKF